MFRSGQPWLVVCGRVASCQRRHPPRTWAVEQHVTGNSTGIGHDVHPWQRHVHPWQRHRLPLLANDP